MYVRNGWYVAAWGEEVGAAPLARTFLDEPVVLFRTGAGEAVALEDRCCHRGLPLSMGKLEGDRLRCGYHGLLFDASGACVEVPGQTHVPPGAGVRRYPLVERYNLVWIWMGDAARADDSLIPDWSCVSDPAWEVARGNGAMPIHMRCNWELNNDNLLDLSHLSWLHASSLGGIDIAKYPVHTERGPRNVRTMRFIPNVPPSPLLGKYRGFAGLCDRWQVSDLYAPTHCMVIGGMARAGAYKPTDDLDAATDFRIPITATPETETTTFMFYAHCRTFAQDDKALTAKMVDDFRRVFQEDVDAMEAQQRMMTLKPGAPTIDINVDAAHLAMRQLLRRLAAGERSEARRGVAAA
jgi:phenylpropionate dioxygenase-like ring-hydroxylating dioxygenase large terminal subunit